MGSGLPADLNLNPAILAAWRYLQWGIVIGFAVLAVELLYHFGPDVKQRFRDSLAGAIVAVMSWIGLSYLLGSYFRHFDNLDRTYGPLGAAIGLYVWFYLSCFAILVGGEINFLLLATCPTSPHRSSLALPRRSSFLKTRYAKRAAPSWIG